MANARSHDAILSLKDEGGDHYKNCRYTEALSKYTEALGLCISQGNEICKVDDHSSGDLKGADQSRDAGDEATLDIKKMLYCNRALCYASLKKWHESLEDAKMSLQIDPNYSKAHFRLVKAYINLREHRDARQCLLRALKECGETPDFKLLEKELTASSGIPVRPRSNDFDVLEELGSGNFSKIYKCSLKATGRVYSLKVIEKQTIQRMKRRHGNINNEVFMEKRVLNKLDHVNIVNMYTTFQDAGALYFQMEFLPGGEVWSRLFEVITTTI
jgi:tetratricopeptide (TPR) repeat protein